VRSGPIRRTRRRDLRQPPFAYPSLLAWTPGKLASGHARPEQHRTPGGFGPSPRAVALVAPPATYRHPRPLPTSCRVPPSSSGCGQGVTTPESGARFEKARTGGGLVGLASRPVGTDQAIRSPSSTNLWNSESTVAGCQSERPAGRISGRSGLGRSRRNSRITRGGPADGLDHDSCLSLPTPDHALGSRSGRGHRHIGGITSMKAARP